MSRPLGWNFKQRHLVDWRDHGDPFLLDTVLISRVGWRVGVVKGLVVGEGVLGERPMLYITRLRQADIFR